MWWIRPEGEQVSNILQLELLTAWTTTLLTSYLNLVHSESVTSQSRCRLFFYFFSFVFQITSQHEMTSEMEIISLRHLKSKRNGLLLKALLGGNWPTKNHKKNCNTFHFKAFVKSARPHFCRSLSKRKTSEKRSMLYIDSSHATDRRTFSLVKTIVKTISYIGSRLTGGRTEFYCSG